MPQDDAWYRSPSWSKNDQTLFYKKIGRSRDNYQKQQYARIKAYSLIDTHKPAKLKAAIELLQKSLDEWQCEFPTELDHTFAALGDAYKSLKDYDNAAEAYETSITWRMNDVHRRYWDYPEMIVSQGLTEKFDRAIEIVNTMVEKEDELVLETDKFIYHAVRAIVLNYQGQSSQAQTDAAAALSIVNVNKSVFRFHPEVGLVDIKKYKQLIKKLKVIAF